MKQLPLLRSWKLSVALIAVAFLLCLSLGGGYANMGVISLCSTCIMFAPFYLCLTHTLAGLAPAAAVLAILTGALTLMGGAVTALIGFLYMGAILLTQCLCMARGIRFPKAVLLMAAVHLLSLVAIVGGLQIWAGGELYARAADEAILWLRSEMDDTMLFATVESIAQLTGILPRVAEDAGIIEAGQFIFYDAAREQLYNEIRMVIESYLTVFVSGSIVTGTVISGIFSLAYPLYRGRLSYLRRAARDTLRPNEPEVPMLDMPMFSKWYLPRGVGLQVGLLALGYLLAMTDNRGLAMAGSMMASVFAAVYMVQGASTVDFFLKRRDMRRGGRRAVVIIIWLLVSQALTIIGILDQLTNIRMLRPPTEAQKQRAEIIKRMKDESNKTDGKDE